MSTRTSFTSVPTCVATTLIGTVAATLAEPDDLARAKTRLVADAVYAQDSQATLARWYGAALTTGLTTEDVAAWPDGIDAVSAEEIRDCTATWLTKRRCVTGFLMPEVVETRPAAD